MSAISLGDLARTFLLRRQNVALKSQAQRLSTEMVTGLAADPRQRLKGDLTALGGIDRSLSLLAARKSVTAETALVAAGMQTALSAIDSAAGQAGRDLLSLGTNGSTFTIDQLGRNARGALHAAVSALNTRIGDRTIFGGVNSHEAAVMDADDIMTELTAYLGSASTPQEIEAAVTAWFEGGAYSQAGEGLAPVAVSATETVRLGITASDSSIRDTLAGLALAALLDDGVLAGSSQARAELATRAGNLLLNNQSARVELAAGLGAQEKRIEAAATANAAEMTALQIARVDLLGVDGYEAATRLEATQTQIETIYSLTARLSRLSLVDYL